MPFLRHRGGAAADRLSTLPDELIDHILSFIPDTKFRARTSILSKRWRHLWSSQPSIFFRLPFNHGPRPPLGITPDQAHHYITAVDTSLRASKTPILRTLSVDLPIRHTRFEARRAASRWLRIAAKKSIRELHLTSQVISTSLSGDSSVPKSIFTCQSLTVLDIYRCNFSVPLSFQGFAVLTVLSLQYTRITQRSLMNLLSKCPLVVNLKVGACSSIKRLCLSSGVVPKLRDLVVYNIGSVEVRVPGLTSFMYVGSLSKLYLMDSPALVSATLECFGGLGSCFDRKKLVSAFSTTVTLRVNDWFFQDYHQENPIAVFKNLKKLHCDVKWMTNDVLCALAAFIETSPNLEELCVDLSFGSRGQIQKYMTSNSSAVPSVHDNKEVMQYFDLLEREMSADVTLSKGVPLESPLEVRTPLNHLKVVTVREYIGTINESRLVKFLLANAVALERLNVICFSRKNQCKVQEMFASFHKTSQQVQISSDDRAVA